MNLRELHTDRLNLLEPSPADEANVIAVHRDPATNDYNPAGPATPEQAARMLQRWLGDWQRDGLGYWIARDRASGGFVGVGGIRLTGEIEDRGRVANLYYRFVPRWWGRGLAGELSAAAIEVARSYGSPLVVVAIVHPDNAASAAVARRAGLICDGRIQHNGGERMRLVLPIVT